MVHENDEERRLAFLRRVRDTAFENLTRCTFPFYARQDGKYILLGSGVLVAIGQKHLGITAAHVLDDIGRCLKYSLPVLIPPGKFGQPLIRLTKFDTFRSTLPPSGERKDDYVDIGIIDFPDDLILKLKKTRRFLNISEIDLWGRIGPESRYLIFGYPKAGSETDDEKRSVSYEAMPYATIPYSVETVELPCFQKDIEIVVAFKPETSSDQDGEPSGTLEPKGISGCGIWRLIEDVADCERWQPDMLKLVGIEHTWHKPAQVLRGTQIRVVIEAIFHHFPELRQAMRLVIVQKGR